MPEVSDQGLDVSKEEERYLRRTFRRFALPYVIALAVFAWAVSSWSGDAGTPPGLDTLQQELARAVEAISVLEGRVEAAAEQAERAGARAAAASKHPGGASAAELEGELRAALRRIAQLEAKLQDKGAHTRIDALSDRIGRVERSVESFARDAAAASPAPAAPSPPPAAPPAP